VAGTVAQAGGGEKSRGKAEHANSTACPYARQRL